MLFILKNRGLIKVREIAEKLEVSEKQVKRYKEELDQYFDIESISGPNGGYRLKEMYFPFKTVLSEEEIALLKYTVDSLEDISEENNNKIRKAIDKINYSILNQFKLEDDYVIPYSKSAVVSSELIEKVNEIYKAIINNLEIEIRYEGNSGHESQRTIQPYKFIIYKGERYLVANCLLRNEIRYFKVRRIKEYNIKEKVFTRNIDINKVLQHHKTERFGIYDGDIYNVVMEIYPPLAKSIKEKIWVDNQNILVNEDGSIVFKAEIQESPELISWILGMAEHVKVLEPEELKLELRNKLNKMTRNL